MVRAGLFACLTAFWAVHAHAASLEVAPIALELPAKGGAAQLRLVNHGDKPSQVQIEAFAWTQNGSETLSDSDDIVLSPPQARLDADSSQIVRLVIEPGADAAIERAFRMVVTELPDAQTVTTGARVLLQFSVPVFAGDGKLNASALTWSLHRTAQGARLEVRNTGMRRAKFTHLELAGRARISIAAQSLVYVLAGSTRSWDLPGASGEGWHLEGIDEIAGRRVSIALAVSD